MPMDPQLAAIYGTGGDETDTEKLAAAKLAEELVDKEELDPSKLTDEQAEELAKKVLAGAEEGEEEEEQEAKGEEEAEEETEEEEESEEKTSSASDEAQEKLAEADYLGRVMAHAYVQELRNISSAQEKTASKAKVASKPKTASKAKKANKVANFLKKKAAAPEPKQPSALDVLAERRALEILKENGIEPGEPKQEKEEEKQSASKEEMAALAQKVEERAFQMLQTAGYIQEEAQE